MGRLSKYSREVREMLSLAREEVLRLRHRLIGTEHLLLGLLRLNNPLVEGLFISLHTSPLNITQALDFVIGRGRRALVSEPVLSAAARATLARAEEAALARHAELIGLEHILLGIFGERDGVAMGVLESFGIYSEVACRQLESLLAYGYEHLVTSIKYQEFYNATPMLNLVCRDLTIEALEGRLTPLIGRVPELERTMQILSRRTKNNPALIGPAGVGKTALAEGLAWRIIQGQVPDTLQDCRVVALDLGLLTSGVRFRGDFEERLKSILYEIRSTPNMIVMIDELHTLVQLGVAEGSLDIANLFKPLLARGEFRCIGATTLDEYRKTIENDPALERRFQAVLMAATNPAETLEILHGLRNSYEEFHHVTITEEALLAAVSMSSLYIHGRQQPDSALDLIDEAASRARVKRSFAPPHVQQLRMEATNVQREKDVAIALRNFPLASHLLKRERSLRKALLQAVSDWRLGDQQLSPLIGEQEIAEVVSLRTGIPIQHLSQEEQSWLLNLEQELHQHIVGQDEAVEAVARAMRRARTHVRDMRRPIGAFLFVGPTGVGKTELARTLAVSLFGDEKSLIQLDMSEFMEYHHVSRLIGAPPGYVGYDQAGQLTEAVRQRPYSIVLFDEIEKAHPKVLDLLLQICEDGSLTDARGRAISFKHSIIIMTSNAGTEHCRPGLSLLPFRKGNYSDCQHTLMREQVLSAVKQTLRPELVNRLDEIVFFHHLHLEHLRKIVYLLIEEIQKRLAKQSIKLLLTDAAYLLLVQQGYDAEYGARFLRRTVQRLLEDMLADAILQGTPRAGDTVAVDVAGECLTLHVHRYLEQDIA